MKRNNFIKVRKHICFFIFFMVITYLGCRNESVVKYTTTVWNFVGKNNKKSLTNVTAEIGFFKDELEKLYAASGLSSTTRSMKDLEDILSKKASQQLSGYYKTFLPILVISKDPKQSLQDFVDKNPQLKLDFYPDSSILTFPIIDTINGVSTTILANVKIRDIIEKQKSIRDIEEIHGIEPYSEIKPDSPPNGEPPIPKPKPVKKESQISMDSLLKDVIKKHSSYKPKRHNSAYKIYIKGVPIIFARYKNNKIYQINKDPEKGSTNFDYDYFDKNGDGFLDSKKEN